MAQPVLHSEAYALSLELGCTPKHAAEVLRARRAKATADDMRRRRIEAESRRNTQTRCDRYEPWMMRD